MRSITKYGVRWQLTDDGQLAGTPILQDPDQWEHPYPFTLEGVREWFRDEGREDLHFMEDVSLRDGSKVVDFAGCLLCDVSSDDGTEDKRLNHARIRVWRTSGGRWVVHRTLVRNGAEKATLLRVVPAKQEVYDLLGFGSLSLRAYAAAGWEL